MSKPNPIPGNKPFKKGVSGNPKGRPLKIPELEPLLAKILGEEKNNVSAMEAILSALRMKAAKGDIRAAEVLLNRGYGMPVQKVQQSGDTTIRFIRADAGNNDRTKDTPSGPEADTQ